MDAHIKAVVWSIDIKSARAEFNILFVTRGVSPDNVNFCQPVIIRNQVYGQYNFILVLLHQKTSIKTIKKLRDRYNYYEFALWRSMFCRFKIVQSYNSKHFQCSVFVVIEAVAI